MAKDVQNWLKTLLGSKKYWEVDSNMTSLLETLNVLSLVRGFNPNVLNINTEPIIKKNSYE